MVVFSVEEKGRLPYRLNDLLHPFRMIEDQVAGKLCYKWRTVLERDEFSFRSGVLFAERQLDEVELWNGERLPPTERAWIGGYADNQRIYINETILGVGLRVLANHEIEQAKFAILQAQRSWPQVNNPVIANYDVEWARFKMCVRLKVPPLEWLGTLS